MKRNPQKNSTKFYTGEKKMSVIFELFKKKKPGCIVSSLFFEDTGENFYGFIQDNCVISLFCILEYTFLLLI